MFNLFSKPDPKDAQREADRSLRKASRDIERERLKLEQEEKKLILEIKKTAKSNPDACKILAKQLVQLRKQKTRTYAANSKIQGIGAQSKAVSANTKLAEALNVAGKTMSDVNKMMRPEVIAGVANNFSKETMKMDMTEEMMNEAFDDILASSDEEKETDSVVTGILDEIGIEISGQLPKVPKNKIGETSKQTGLRDDEIEKQLAKLRA